MEKLHSLINIIPRKYSNGSQYFQARFFDRNGHKIKTISIPKITTRSEAYLYARQKLGEILSPVMQLEDINQFGVLSVKEVRQILKLPDNDETSARNTLIVLLGITCGLSVSEIRNLKREHITEFDMFKIISPDGDRFIPFIRNVKDRLDKMNKYYPDCQFVIPNIKDATKPCDPISISRGLSSILNNIEITKERNIIPSVLWETFVTLLVSSHKEINNEVIDYLCGFNRLSSAKYFNENRNSIINAIQVLMNYLDGESHIDTKMMNWYNI